MTKPSETPSAGRARRASIRTIAEAAGVSAMTVSKALRNLPKVSAQTRARILRIASRIGYTPDPELARLMLHLRRRSQPTYQGLLCAITNRSTDQAHPYVSALIESARRQAESRGYGFSLFQLTDGADRKRRLRRILWARRVQGVLLLPMREPIDASDLLPWDEFPVVAVSPTILAPALHRVMPHHFANTLHLCAKLDQRGYRRLGLVIDADQEARVNRAFSGAVVRHNFDGRRVTVAPFIYQRYDAAALRTWFRRESPDVVIATSEQLCRQYADTLGCRIPGPFAFASTNTSAQSPIAGIDECPEAVGANGIDLLGSLILHGERGLPAHPASTEVHGKWHAGISCPSISA